MDSVLLNSELMSEFIKADVVWCWLCGDACGDIAAPVVPELSSCWVRLEKVVMKGRFALEAEALRRLFVEVDDELDNEWFDEGLGEDIE